MLVISRANKWDTAAEQSQSRFYLDPGLSGEDVQAAQEEPSWPLTFSLQSEFKGFFVFLYFYYFPPFIIFFIVSDHKNKQEDESCYLWCVLPTVHLEEAVSLVSGNTYRCRSITKPHLQISNITITWKVLWVVTNSPLSQLLAAWQSCLGRHLAFPRSPPSTSLHRHNPGQNHF